MALGDVARHVDPAEEERHPLCIFALQGGEAVAGLLEAGAESLGQSVDIVAHAARFLAKPAIGHQQRAGGRGRLLLSGNYAKSDSIRMSDSDRGWFQPGLRTLNNPNWTATNGQTGQIVRTDVKGISVIAQ